MEQLNKKEQLLAVKNDLETGYEEVRTGNPNYYEAKIVEDAVCKVIDMIKSIKGEIPLHGLVYRINRGLSLIGNFKKDKESRTK